jgi:hypothetical protein
MSVRLHLAAARAAALAFALLVGCATPSGNAGTGQHNVLTASELERASDMNLYDALRQMRPTFLRSRAPANSITEQQPVQAYVNGLKMEGLEHLREIQAKNVKEVQFLEPQQANSRFGGNNSGGALIILLK